MRMVTVYQSDDGKYFDSSAKAVLADEEHKAEALRERIGELYDVSEEVVEFVVSCRFTLAKVLKEMV